VNIEQFLEKLSQLPKEQYKVYKLRRDIILRLKHPDFEFSMCPVGAVYHYQHQEDVTDKNAIFMGECLGLNFEDICKIVSAADGYTKNQLHYKLKEIIENLS
jgi:hypothetical protein